MAMMQRWTMCLLLLPLATVDASCEPNGCEDCCEAPFGGWRSRLARITSELRLEAVIEVYDSSRILGSVALGDLNGDGRLDAVFGSAIASGLVLARDISAGAETETVVGELGAGPAPRLAVANVDDDADLDVVATRLGPAGTTLVENHGEAWLATSTLAVGGRSILVAEVDGRPPAEVFVVDGEQRLVPVVGSVTGLALGRDRVDQPMAVDVDGDGDDELAAIGLAEDSRLPERLLLWVNDGGAVSEVAIPFADAGLEAIQVFLTPGVPEVVIVQPDALLRVPFSERGFGEPIRLPALPDGVQCDGFCDVVLARLGDGDDRTVIVAARAGPLVAVEATGTRVGDASENDTVLALDPEGHVWLLDAPACDGEGF